MNQYLDMACPHCGQNLRVRSQYTGQRVICKHCSKSFRVQADSPAPAEDFRPRIAELEGQLARAQADLAETTGQLRQAAAELDRARRDYAELAAERLRLQEELGTACAELARVAGEQHSARHDLALARADCDRLAAERARLAADLAAARQEIDAAQEGHREEEGRSASLARRIEALLKVEAELLEARADRARLVAELSQLRGRLAALTRDDNERNRLLAEREAARAKVSEVTAQWAGLARRADEQQARADRLERSLGEARRAGDEALRLAGEVAELRRQLAGAERLREEKERLLAELTAARADLTAATGRGESEARRAEGLDLALTQSATARQEALAAAERRWDEQHQGVLATFEEERRRWNRADEETRRELDTLRGRLAAAVQKADELRDERDRAAESSRLAAALVEEERRTWQVQAALQAQALEGARRDREAAERHVPRLTGDVNQLKAALAQAGEREKELLAEAAAARKEVEATRRQLVTAEVRHEQLSDHDKYGFEQMLALAQWEADQQRRGLEAELADCRHEVTMLRNTLWGMGVRV